MTAKERFLKLQQSKTFADIAQSDAFHVAMDYAMLEMQRELGGADTDASAVARLNGAAQLRRILETIALPDEVAKPIPSPKLNYDAYNKPARSG